MRAATEDADPPEEPPEVRDGSQGFLVVPNARFLHPALLPNIGAFVLPTTMAPAFRSRATWGGMICRLATRKDVRLGIASCFCVLSPVCLFVFSISIAKKEQKTK